MTTMTDAEIIAAGEKLVLLGAEQERRAIVQFLCRHALSGVEHTLEWPFWRKLLWGLCYPLRLNRAVAISKAAIAINSGDYAKELV